MKGRIIQLWETLSSGLWFIPTLLSCFAALLSYLTLLLDRNYGHEKLRTLSYIWVGSAEGARAVLATIAGSTIGVAGVSFSITIVTLSLASTQFGPRLLRNFLGNTSNQVVLGTFVATYLYCLLILRTVHSGNVEFVPWISVTFAVVFSILSLGMLIYFIHNVTHSIQGPEVIAAVSRDVKSTLLSLYKEVAQEPQKTTMSDEKVGELPSDFQTEGYAILGTASGYIQYIDYEKLLDLCCENNVSVRLLKQYGDYADSGLEMMWLHGSNHLVAEVEQEFVNVFSLGTQRLIGQDLRFGMEQLVEIAVRALSPGTNDPFTAINCVDQLGTILRLLKTRKIPSDFRYDKEGIFRIQVRSVSYSEAVDLAFSTIKFYGKEHPSVMNRIAATCEDL